MKIYTTVFSALALSLVAAGGATAATYNSILSCDEIADVNPDADDCFGTTAENANAQQVNLNTDTFVEGATSTVGLFGFTDWVTFQSNPNFNGGPTGSFNIIANDYANVVVLLKSANTFAAYLYESGLEGTLNFFTANDRGLSNYVVAGRGTPNVVPLPAAGWLLLAGVGGLVAMRRKKAA
jgi:hypothetical protein